MVSVWAHPQLPHWKSQVGSNHVIYLKNSRFSHPLNFHFVLGGPVVLMPVSWSSSEQDINTFISPCLFLFSFSLFWDHVFHIVLLSMIDVILRNSSIYRYIQKTTTLLFVNQITLFPSLVICTYYFLILFGIFECCYPSLFQTNNVRFVLLF